MAQQLMRAGTPAEARIIGQRLPALAPSMAGRVRRRCAKVKGLENGAAFPHHDDFEAWWWLEDVLLDGAPNQPSNPEAGSHASMHPSVPYSRRAPSSPLKYSLQEWRSFRARLVALEQERLDSLYLSDDDVPSESSWTLCASPPTATSGPTTSDLPACGPGAHSTLGPSPASPSEPSAIPASQAFSSTTYPSLYTSHNVCCQDNGTGPSTSQPSMHSRNERGTAASPSQPNHGNIRSSHGGMPRHRGSRPPRSAKQSQSSVHRGQQRDPGNGPQQQRQPPRPGKPPKAQPALPQTPPARPLLLSAGPGSWAHLLSHPEPGCVLLAKGGSDMAFFDRAVILLTSHSDSRGSVGFVLNKASPLKVSELQLASSCPGFMEVFGGQRLQIGGPMHMDHATVLHRYMGLSGANEVADKLYAGGLPDAVQLIEAGLAKAWDFHLMLGVSGWAPRQLQAEVAKGMWHCVSASPDLVLPRKGSAAATADAIALAKEGQDMWARILGIAAGPEAIMRPWL